MRIRVQVVIEADGGVPPAVHQVADLRRDALQADTLGLQLAETKELLTRLQKVVVDEQVRACLAARIACPHCRRPRRHKDQRTIAMRTLFGTLRLTSPRWHHCPCRAHERQTFSPLTEVLPERTTPELLYLEARFAGLMSYGLSANLLGELLPLGRPPHPTSVRRHVQATAQRLEEELGPEQVMFIQGCPRDWEEPPVPDLPLTVGLDGGYVHACDQRSRREGWFEVIAGKSMPAEGEAKSFAYVQTYDTKPKRRLFRAPEVPGDGRQPASHLPDRRRRRCPGASPLPQPQAEHLIDSFHITCGAPRWLMMVSPPKVMTSSRTRGGAS